MKTEIETKMAEKTKPVCETMEKMVSAFKAKLDEGIETIDSEEAYKVADIIKDMSEAYKNINKALYYETVSAAMEKESESGDDEEMEDGEQKFYTRRLKDSRGRFRRGYTNMGMDERYYTPERDMDRESMGRMYYSQGGSRNYTEGNGSSRNYTEGGNSSSRNYSDGNMTRDYREGMSGMSRRNYVENPSKQNLEKHIDDIGNDVKELIQNTTPENKIMVKNKLIALANAM